MKKKEIGKGYNKKIYSFFIGALLILLYLIVVNIRNFVGDAGDYWISAEQYGFENFQLINYNSSIRGYLFPLVLYFVQRLAQIAGIEGVVVYWIVVSIFFSFTFQVAFPDIVSRCMGNAFSYSLWGKLIFLLIIIYMFKGMFIYPLTDLWALSILICAIWCMLKAENKEMCGGGYGGNCRKPFCRNIFFPTGIFSFFGYSRYYCYNRYGTSEKNDLCQFFCRSDFSCSPSDVD